MVRVPGPENALNVEISRSHLRLAPLLFWSFAVIARLLLLATLVALIMHAYADAKRDTAEAEAALSFEVVREPRPAPPRQSTTAPPGGHSIPILFRKMCGACVHL